MISCIYHSFAQIAFQTFWYYYFSNYGGLYMEQISRYEIGSVTNTDTNLTYPLLIVPDSFAHTPESLKVELNDGHLDVIDTASKTPLLRYLALPEFALKQGAILLGFPHHKTGMQLYSWSSDPGA
jgi:hypothetical protein